MSQELQIAEALFGKEADPLLTRAFKILTGVRSPIHEKILEVCVESKAGGGRIARIVVATTVEHPYNSYMWLDAIATFFDGGSTDSTVEFGCGVFLGLFQSVVWLDKNWDGETKFQENFPKLIVSLLLSKHEALGHPGTVLQSNPTYEGRLSEAVNAYAHGAPHTQHSGKGIRIANVQRILTQTAHVLIERQRRCEKEGLTPLQEMVLEQLSYTAFGTFSAGGKARAVAAFFDEFLETIKISEAV